MGGMPPRFNNPLAELSSIQRAELWRWEASVVLQTKLVFLPVGGGACCCVHAMSIINETEMFVCSIFCLLWHGIVYAVFMNTLHHLIFLCLFKQKPITQQRAMQPASSGLQTHSTVGICHFCLKIHTFTDRRLSPQTVQQHHEQTQQ